MDRDFDFSLVAAGNVYPSRFVALGAAADNTGLQATANQRTIGISGTGTDGAPGTPFDSGYIAQVAGLNGTPETIPVFGPGRKCLLKLGGTVTRGARLVSDANGQGVAAPTSGPTMQEVGAIALQSGVSGQLILVLVAQQPWYPTLS